MKIITVSIFPSSINDNTFNSKSAEKNFLVKYLNYFQLQQLIFFYNKKANNKSNLENYKFQ